MALIETGITTFNCELGFANKTDHEISRPLFRDLNFYFQNYFTFLETLIETKKYGSTLDWTEH